MVEVKAMIKEAHINVIPKYGFPLTADSTSSSTIKTQIHMQTTIDACAHFDGVIMQLAQETLPWSGVATIRGLPVRLKGQAISMRKPSISKHTNFRHHDPLHKVLFGRWAGESRAPMAFLEAPSFDLMQYL